MITPRNIGRVAKIAAVGLVLVIGSLMLCVELALDRAPRYQAQIKDWVYRQTGYHIAFAAVSPAFRWYGPELYLSRLELRSRDDLRVLARAAGGRIGIDLWHLVYSRKLFSLRVELDSPDIVIDRLGPSEFALASEIVFGGEQSPVSSLTLDQLPVGTLVMHKGSVTLKHWNPELPELELSALDLQLSHVENLLAAKLSARLPETLGGRLSFTGALRGAGRLDDLLWSATANSAGMLFPGWRRLLPEYLERLDTGTGEFQAAAHGRGGRLERVDLDFGARDLVTRLSEGATTRLDEVSAALSLTHAVDRWTLLGRRVRAVRGGHRDPNSEFDVSWRDNDTGMLELKATANYLRAEAFLPLVRLMPQKDVRERLRELAPTGEWMDMRLSLERAASGDPWRFDARAKFRGVGFAPFRGMPGLRGLSGVLAGNEAAGHLYLDTVAAVFNWPNQFPQPVDLPRLKTSLYWKRSAEELLLATSDLELRTRDVTLRGKLAWHQPSDGSSPVLTTANTIEVGNVADAHLYFPRELLSAGALQWLNRAFLAGHLPRGEVIFNGPVRQFPFRDGGGLFLARFRVDHLGMDYQEGWPKIDNMVAQAEFRNQGMDVKVASADIGDIKIDSAEARFVDFKNAELEVHAAAHGAASAAVHYMANTPIDALAEHAFSSVEAKGSLKTGIDLLFPLKQFDQRRVLVHLDLDTVSLNRTGSALAATQLTGGADIDGAQVVRADIRGRFLGGPMQMTARAPRNRQATRTRLEFRGTATGEALRSALSLPPAIAIDGQADYRAVLRMAPEPARDRTLSVSSSLAGLELRLPAPLAKAAATTQPTTLAVQWLASGGEDIRVNFGSVLRAAAVLDSDSNSVKLGRGAISFGDAEPTFSDSQPLNIGGTIGELDLAGWLKLAGTDAVAGNGGSGRISRPLAAYLRAAKLQVGKIDYLGFSFSDVSIAIAEAHGGWQILTDGPTVTGLISLPGTDAPSMPWKFEFERLIFSQEPTAGPDSAARRVDARNLPSIEFHAADLACDDRHFGDVRATLAKLDDGVSLRRLTLTNASWSAAASGEWRGRDAGSSHVQGTVTTTDAGDTLKDLGFAAILEAKTGHAEFDMTWAGDPNGEALAAAKGHIEVSLDKGQVVGLKPGAGRVLGLASVAELPRRLALDFSDVTDKGFAFDTAHGEFDLHDGNAYTDDVLVKGPAAEIGLIGRIGLKNRDYDQTAVVTGNVSSTLPLAAFAAGPVVGGAVLLFTQVFKQPLKGLARGYYRITGSWDNPTVERIKSADATAESTAAVTEAEK